MNDLDTEIRRAVFEWAEHAPVPPAFDELTTLASPTPTRSTDASPMGGRRLFLAAAIVSVIALAGGVAWVSTHQRDPSVGQAGVAPMGATLADVAGQTLPVRMGFAGSPPGYALDYEFIRDQAVTAGLLALPTGPLGPVYAQYIVPPSAPADYTIPASQTDDTLPDPSHWAIGVVTVLPVEQGDVVQAAAGHTDGISVMVNGHDGVAITAWSASDDNVVSWQQDGVAVIAVGSSITALAQIERVAAEVAPVDHTPVLTTVGPTVDLISRAGALTGLNGSWSLTPGQGTVVSRDDAQLKFNGWSVLSGLRPLWNAFSTVMAHSTGEIGRFTVRAAGSPGSHWPLEPINLPDYGDPGSPGWSDTIAVVLGMTSDGAPDSIQGFTPTDVLEVRLVFSDGRIRLAPTYDVGRGWPVRAFLLPVPDIHDDLTPSSLHVVRIDGLGVGGAVLMSGPSMLGNDVGGTRGGPEATPRCPIIPESCAAAGG